jgi:hypothetical protein
MNRSCAIVIALVLVALTAGQAIADSKGQSESVWSAEDRCATEAARLFPDYTPQGNAARENYRRACLRAHNLPAPDGQAGASN